MRPTRPQHPRRSARGRPRPAGWARTAACPGPQVLSQLREECAPVRLPAPPRSPAGPVGGQRCRLDAPGRRGSGCIPPTLQPPPLCGRHLLARGRASFSSGRRMCHLPPRAAPQVARRSKPLAKRLRKDRPSPRVPPLACEGESGAPAPLLHPHLPPRAPLRPGSAPRPPPAPAAAAAGAGRSRNKGAPSPRARSTGPCASSLAPWRIPGLSSAAPALQGAGMWWEKQQPRPSPKPLTGRSVLQRQS